MVSEVELLVQYEPGVQPIRVVRTLLSEWGASGRPPLLRFARGGVGDNPNLATLEEALCLSPTREDVSLRLRTGRAHKGVDVVEAFFTNPSWAYSRPANYISVSFVHEGVIERAPGYTVEALAKLLSGLVTAGVAWNGFIALSEVLRTSWVERMLGLFPARDHLTPPERLLHWITYLPQLSYTWLLERTGKPERIGIQRLRHLSNRGAIVAVGNEPPRDPAQHLDELKRIACALGLCGTQAGSDALDIRIRATSDD